MLKEFKEFAMRGNVVDMAVGVIIGGAFGKIVTSLVSDLVMPPIGLLLGGMNFADYFISLNGNHYDNLKAAQAAGAPTLNYGNFLQTTLDFIILAFAIFLMVKMMNKLQRKPPEAPAPPAPSAEVALLGEIRDLLKK